MKSNEEIKVDRFWKHVIAWAMLLSAFFSIFTLVIKDVNAEIAKCELLAEDNKASHIGSYVITCMQAKSYEFEKAQFNKGIELIENSCWSKKADKQTPQMYWLAECYQKVSFIEKLKRMK